MSPLGMAKGAWRFRDFVAASVKREFATRFLGTQFGFLWAIAQPLALVLIYTLVFAAIMKPALVGHSSRYAYSIYLTSGIITWTFFSELLARSVGIFVQNAHLLKKVNIPKITLPLIAAFSSLLNLAIVLIIFLAFTALAGFWPGWTLLAVVPVLAIVIAFTVGLGILLGTINVFYRDIEQGVGMALQFWFWLTPIVYPARALPPYLESFLTWNPMWPIVRAMQEIFLEQRFPNWGTLAYPLVVALVLLALAYRAFNSLSGELVDEL